MENKNYRYQPLPEESIIPYGIKLSRWISASSSCSRLLQQPAAPAVGPLLSISLTPPLCPRAYTGLPAVVFCKKRTRGGGRRNGVLRKPASRQRGEEARFFQRPQPPPPSPSSFPPPSALPWTLLHRSPFFFLRILFAAVRVGAL